MGMLGAEGARPPTGARPPNLGCEFEPEMTVSGAFQLIERAENVEAAGAGKAPKS